MSKIVIESLTKKYGDTVALDHINLTIEPNKIYGLLGRNGAGKTTLLNLITNKIFPTGGNVFVDDEKVIENDNALSKIFYMLEKNLYPEGYRIKEIYKWANVFYPTFDVKYAYDLCKKFGLNVNKKVKELSTGYTTIFKDVLALSTEAPILLLDEPVLGLDANHRELFYKELIANYIAKPKTIIISTHLIEEVSEIIEEVIIIKEGKIILKQSVEDLLTTAYKISGEISKVDQYISNKNYIGIETMGKYKSVTILESQRNKEVNLIKELDLDVSKVELQKLFIHLTN